jgi:signal transduction histidine kinase
VVPLVLLLLVATGYFIAGRAVVPVEESFVVLRRFMSNASHELGTPLSIMQANLESLELDLEKKGQKVEKLEVVNRSVERMKTLVADLNLLARVENPHHVLPRQNINMQDLIRVIMAEYSQAFCDKNIQLKEGQIQSIVVNGHADSIKRVFLNLLQNALRYTNAGGTVTVNCTASDKLCRLSVSDTGIGITKEDLPHIFERFYRSDVARERSSNGSGLGLSIVKAVAIWHGGKVEVHSKLDAGTTFVVSLPIS